MSPTATTILLVRHGSTLTTGTVLPGRAPGLHLSERGTAQAEAVAQAADAVVVGSAVVNQIAEHGKSKDLVRRVGRFVESLVSAVKDL